MYRVPKVTLKVALAGATLAAGLATSLMLAPWALSVPSLPAADAATISAAAAVQRGLVVHEWGTFTSFSGSDGVRLEFRPLVDDDLPNFVLHRGEQAGVLAPFMKARYFVRERMETPVTYFYTDHEREVRVKVGFPQGMLTEFYPPVETMHPTFDAEKVQKLENSGLDWGRVRLIPESHLKTHVTDPVAADVIGKRLLNALVPPADGNHYKFARQTDSAIVHMQLPPNPNPHAPQGDFFEKFLFYRGIGAFQLPIHVEARSAGRFTVTNNGPEEIRGLFLVTVEGKHLRLATAHTLDANSQLTMTVQEATTLDHLGDAVVTALVAEGLYAKEAVAMVNTWKASWFGEDGTRLFYMVPRRITDELLPLTISPTPDEMVRVLVGRYEIMSPEDEARITGLVQASIRARTAFDVKAEHDEQTRANGYPIPEDIVAMGRLTEPALVRIKLSAKDPAVKAEAVNLLADWEAWKLSAVQ